jgi:hypothetical protein
MWSGLPATPWYHTKHQVKKRLDESELGRGNVESIGVSSQTCVSLLGAIGSVVAIKLDLCLVSERAGMRVLTGSGC